MLAADDPANRGTRMDKDKKRAMGDFACAARKLAALFREQGYSGAATDLDTAAVRAKRIYDAIVRAEKEA